MSNQKRKGCLPEAIRGLLGACAGFWSLLLSGCGESGEEVLNLAGKDVVLAEVNERQITLETYRQYVDRVQADLREGIEPQRYLQAIIEEELLLREAEGLGLDQVPELAALRQRETRVLVLRELYRRHGIESPRPSEEELRVYFAASPYSRQVRFSLLMVKTLEQMQSMLEQLEAGADFTELSVRNSQDSRILVRNADMGYHRWGETESAYQPIVAKAYAMEIGQIAGPLKVANGYFLIKLTDIHPIPLEQERETIEQLLIQERLAVQLASYFANLQQRYELEVNPQGIQALESSLSRGEGSPSMPDSGLQVISYNGGTLNLAGCHKLLNEGGDFVPTHPQKLRQHLLQQVCRQVLVPLEIEQLGLVESAPVRQGLEKARRKFLVQQLRTYIASRIPPSGENALRLFFAQNEERYIEPRQVEVRRMPVPDLQTGRLVVEKLKAGQDTLDLAARFVPVTYSGEALEENMPMSRALQAEAGSIHGPFPTDVGYVILQILRQRAPRLPAFEEIQEQVARDYLKAAADQRFRAFLQELKNRYAEQINIYPERLRAMKLLVSEKRSDE